MKNFKKVLAFLCSATLIVGSSVTAFATEPASGTTPASTTGGTGNLVAYSVETVTVPTAVKVSFNPQGWDFTVRGTGNSAVTSDAQVVSLNYGIATEATLDKKITVSFNAVATNGDGTKDVTFVDSAAKAEAKSTTNTDGAAPGEYKMYLAVAPSDAAVAKGYDTDGTTLKDFKVDDTTKKTTVTTALLSDVVMDAATVGVQAFENNKAELQYKLDAAEYVLKQDAVLDFTTTQANIASKFDTKTIGSVVGFTFVGAMNPNVDWTKAKISALAITPTYEVEDVDGTETVLTGDGAGYNVIGEAAAEAKELTGSYDSASSQYRINLEAAVSAVSDITNVKVDGTTVAIKELNGSKNIAKIDRSAVRDALGGTSAPAWASATEFTFTFTVDGVNYTCTISKN